MTAKQATHAARQLKALNKVMGTLNESDCDHSPFGAGGKYLCEDPGAYGHVYKAAQEIFEVLYGAGKTVPGFTWRRWAETGWDWDDFQHNFSPTGRMGSGFYGTKI